MPMTCSWVAWQQMLGEGEGGGISGQPWIDHIILIENSEIILK